MKVTSFKWHRRELFSSDLSPLFISIHTLMLNNKNQSAILSDMALEAMEDVIIADDIVSIRESLKDFFLEWFQSEDEKEQEEERIMRVFHYRVMLGILIEAEKIKAIKNA